jgi:hypothetical protein
VPGRESPPARGSVPARGPLIGGGPLAGIAPGLGSLGVMLPYTPLHVLLLGIFLKPLSNLSNQRLSCSMDIISLTYVLNQIVELPLPYSNTENDFCSLPVKKFILL